MLSLREALRTGRLQAFIEQEQARGLGKSALRKMDRALARMLVQLRSRDKNSRSRSRSKRKIDGIIFSDLSPLAFLACLV
jgi:hypothetical protein